MLNNDIGKRLMIRFKKSKDFGKTIMKLQLEGFGTIQTYTSKKRQLKVLKDGKEVLYMVYEDLDDFRNMKEYEYWKEDVESNNGYRQNILAIYY